MNNTDNINRTTNKTFIKIPNSLFTIERNEFGEEIGISIFKQIGTEGFTIWTYLLYTQGNQVSAQTTIKRINSFLNRNKNTRNKKSKNGLNDTRTIKKYLNVLLKINMITVEQFIDEDEMELFGEQISTIDFTNTRADEELFIQVNNMDDGNGFSIISLQLYFDYIHKIGHIGWSIYCLLFKNHNVNFGNTNDDEYSMKNYGFATCSEEYISKILNRNRSTISEYITNVIPDTLIKTLPQESTTWDDFKTDTKIQTYMPNHYIVRAKYDPENKYYIDTNK